MPAGDAHQLPEPVRVRGLGHLAQTEVDALGEEHVEQTDAVAAGLSGSQVREGLGEPGGVVHLEQDVGDPRLGQPPVEVGDQVGGPVWHGGFRPLDAEHAVFDAPAGDRIGPCCGGQPAQTLVEGEPAFGEPVVRAGRDRQAAVGITEAGSRQQRLSDVAEAARSRQPDRRAPPDPRLLNRLRRYGMTGSQSYRRRARARDKAAEAAYDSRVDTDRGVRAADEGSRS